MDTVSRRVGGQGMDGARMEATGVWTGWLVGLDYGQTGIKVVALRPGSSLRVGAVPSVPREAVFTVGPVTYRHLSDPEKLFQRGVALVADLLGPDDDTPIAIAVSSAGPPLVAVDAANRALCPVIGYWEGMDEAAAESALPFDRRRFARLAGGPYDYHPPVVQLAWLTQRDNELASRLAAVLSIGGYVAARLSGRRAAEPSTAGASGAFNRETRGWADTVLRAGGLRRAWFPPVVPSGTLLGEGRIGRHPTWVVSGAHDYLAAALAAGLSEPDEALNLLGTWEMATRFVRIGPRGGWGDPDRHRTLHDLHVVPERGTFTLECWLGGQIEWARQMLGLSPAEFFARAAAAGPAAPRGLSYAPFLGSQFFPPERRGHEAGFFGLGPSTTRDALARAVLEGLAYLGARMVEQLEAVAEEPMARIVLGGGASRNRLMAELKADMLNRPVWVHRVPDLSGLGAALLAGVGVGVYADVRAARESFKDAIDPVYPDAARHRVYRGFFDARHWV